MEKPETNRVRDARQNFDLSGAHAAGSSLPASSKAYRLKVFKSGNSLALRLPKVLGLAAGMELELKVGAGGTYALSQVEPAKRKFNIDKVWGCAIGSGLQPIDPDDRWFEERPLLWDDPDWRAKHTPEK